MQNGDMVLFYDAYGKEHAALVTRIWGDLEVFPNPSINVVYVTKDDNLTDPYGNQIIRETSVPYRDQQAAPGKYWKRLA